MLIKVVQNGIESDWFQLTKKTHRELIKKKPEAAVIHIEDIYLCCSLKKEYPIQQYISWQNPTRESDLADARRPPVRKTLLLHKDGPIR